jgi:glycosyltransferase involved in cell wall biosynthesis
MKVMHYHLGKDGGAEKFFVHLVNGLARRGVEQTCVIRPKRLWKKDIEPVARIIESNFRNAHPDRILLPMRIGRIVRREKPDALFSWATRASRLIPAYEGAIKISRLGDYPTNLSYFKNTDVLVCNTPGIAKHVRETLGWDRGVEVISNFTDVTAVAPVTRASVDTPEGVPVVMSMGRFVSRKEFALLIAAVAKLPEAYLWLAGDGEERGNLERIAADLGISERVRFLGWQQDTRPYVAACDIFVMPSSHEPLGNVVLEAWAQKRPVVSSRSEGPSWFMRHGENGLLVDIGDTDGFSNAIKTLINDEALAAKIAAGGHQTVLGQFSEDAIVDAYMALFARRS